MRPSLDELSAAGNVARNANFDPSTNTSPTVVTIQQGNPNLMPERALLKSVGVVVQPAFMPGFQASVDYWTISIKDAVTTLLPTNVINLYFQGRAEFCSRLTRDAGGVLTEVSTGVFNFAEARNRGIDIEASYGLPVSDIVAGLPGRLSLNATATVYLEGYLDNGITPAIDNAGVIGQLS